MSLEKGKFSVEDLSRRIVYPPFEWNGDLQDGIEKLLNENLIDPKNEGRKIPGVVFVRNILPEQEVFVTYDHIDLLEAAQHMASLGGYILVCRNNIHTQQAEITLMRR